MVQALVGLLVSITLVLLPLAALLALQLEFLAYQIEAVTWAQRVATWLDVALIVALWPIILHPRDDWRELLAAHVPNRRAWAAVALLVVGLILFLFSVSKLPAVVGLGLLALSPLAAVILRNRRPRPRRRVAMVALAVSIAITVMVAGTGIDSRELFLPVAMFWHPRAPRGSLALLFTLYVGPLVPLALFVNGEAIERLVVRAQGTGTKLETSLISKALLGDRRRLDLTEQVLLAKAPNPETLADIRSDRWQEAMSRIEPVNLTGRSLRGAQMFRTVLMRADLRDAKLQGANLRNAALYGSTGRFNGILVDLREASWKPLTDAVWRAAMSQLAGIPDPGRREAARERLKPAVQAGLPKPVVASCLASAEWERSCKRRVDPTDAQRKQEFVGELHAALTTLACGSPDAARGIIRQIPEKKVSDSTRAGLQVELKKRLDDPTCAGLHTLRANEKDRLRAMK